LKQLVITLVLGLAMAFPARAAPPVKGDPSKGGKIAGEVCIACHGADGNGSTPPNPEFPKIAAKQPEYILKQLKDFKAGKRKNDIMAAMVATLTPDDMANLAVYFAAQKGSSGTIKEAALLGPGKKIYHDGNSETGVPGCAGCHMPDASGTDRFPRLAGQHAEYTLLQLKRFQTGERDNDKGLAMQSVSAKMTEAEMKAVAEYVAGLK